MLSRVSRLLGGLAMRRRHDQGLVATAFASLNFKDENHGEAIKLATDVPSLLRVAENKLSREDSLLIISKLSEWSATDKIKLSEFEKDHRFVKLVQSLGNQTQKQHLKQNADSRSDDLNTIVGVAGDEEAARLIASLNLMQMIKVMTILSSKKRRSTSLLRTLSYNVSRCSEKINLKQCSDLLYAMTVLNFPDRLLLDRICSDIQENLLVYSDKSSIVGSIATSLGMMKYKDDKLLDCIAEWFMKHKHVSRNEDITAFVTTMAILGYNNENSCDFSNISRLDIIKSCDYLDYVWSLVAMQKVSESHLKSVLQPEFVDSLKIDTDLPFSVQKKLMNINGYVKLFYPLYTGPFLSSEISENLKISYSKEKQQFVQSVLDTLKSFLTSELHVGKNCNSKMGFLYDAFLILDEKCNPYPVDTDICTNKKKLMKIAVLGLEYHDMCWNTMEPLGTILLYKRLLEKQEYKVLLVPYIEFSTREKFTSRLQYVERKLKEAVSQ